MVKISSSEWYSSRAATKKLGITGYRLLRLVAEGQVRTLALPGNPLRYSAIDVNALAAQQETPSDVVPVSATPPTV